MARNRREKNIFFALKIASEVDITIDPVPVCILYLHVKKKILFCQYLKEIEIVLFSCSPSQRNGSTKTI